MRSLGHWAEETELGALLVSVGPAGIREVRPGNSVDELLADFERGNPSFCREASLASMIAEIAAIPSGGPLPPALDLDVSGTPFQRLVWDRLRSIPRGATLSYAALAADLGLPKAVRAVASACGANRLALVIPCHRILRTDGGLGGYRWGLELKRRLLEIEVTISGGELS